MGCKKEMDVGLLIVRVVMLAMVLLVALGFCLMLDDPTYKRREAVSEEAIASYELVLFEDGVPYKRYRYGTEEGYLFRYLDGEEVVYCRMPKGLLTLHLVVHPGHGENTLQKICREVADYSRNLLGMEYEKGTRIETAFELTVLVPEGMELPQITDYEGQEVVTIYE